MSRDVRSLSARMRSRASMSLGVGARAPPRQFGSRSDDRDRCAQFVRRVGGELRDAAKRRVEARKHVVQRAGQAIELVVRAAEWKTLGEVFGADGSRGARDAIDRLERALAHPVPACGRHQQDQRGRENNRPGHVIERFVKFADRYTDLNSPERVGK